MSSIDIYAILSSKPHTPHYLNRYWKFIQYCSKLVYESSEYVEKHHICPKAKDLFPEYGALSKFKWNKILISGRHHYICHLLLSKAYGGSQATALMLMVNRGLGGTYNSKLYESSRKELSIYNSKIATELYESYSEEKRRDMRERGAATTRQIYSSGLKIHGNKGRTYTDEYKQKMSMSLKSSSNCVKTPEWNRKNSEANKNRVHIANTITKERKRPLRPDAENLISSSNGVWVKCATNKPIPDYSSLNECISSETSILPSSESISSS